VILNAVEIVHTMLTDNGMLDLEAEAHAEVSVHLIVALKEAALQSLCERGKQ
jgi:hypothetical protein